MNNITHVRIDYRLIHGQVVTKWLKQCNANVIVIIDDELASDDFLSMVYKMATPTGIEFKVISVKDSAQYYETDIFYRGKVLLLFKSIDTVSRCVEQGMKLTNLQVGGLQNKQGLKIVHNQIALDMVGYDKLKVIEDTGVRVYFQTIPGEDPSNLAKVLKKI